MLKGLEIREYKLSDCIQNKDYRIDTDYYIKIPIKNRNLQYKKIGECLLYSQYGISIEMNEENKGYPIYRMNEIHDTLCDLDVDKCADIEEDVFESFQLNDKDVLFNRTNSYDFVGRTGIYYDNDGVKRTFASYLVKLVPKTNIILPEYLTTYLNTEQGIQDIKRHARQSINQTNVNPEEVKDMEIPILSMSFQEEIEDCLVMANKLRCQSYSLYKRTAKCLTEIYDVDEIKHFNENHSAISYNKSFFHSGRLDAEYYLPQYDMLFEKLKRFETKRLGDIVGINKSIEPGSDYYQTEGIPFVRVADITKYGITKPTVYLDRNIFRDAIRPKMNTILLSKDGSVGIAYKVEKDEDIITSGAILHLAIKDEGVLPDYLTLVINSEAVQMQAERDAGGSIIKHWKPSEIENVVIPILPMDEQIKISEMVQESFRLRNKSERLLEVAKKAVEIAISDNEEKAMQFIKENENGQSLYNE